MKQIAVIGSASSTLSESEDAKKVGELIGRLGFSLICGGLGGVMTAACKGFKSSPRSGVTVGILPGHDPSAANDWIDIVIPTGIDVSRNSLVVSSGTGVIAIGGGAGTLSEIALANQLGRSILLFHGSGGWTDQLKDLVFLDDRQTKKLFHAYTLEDVESWLNNEEFHQGAYGEIGSGHLSR
jgi:uncharacterized protein (TIGR00725 family)